MIKPDIQRMIDEEKSESGDMVCVDGRWVLKSCSDYLAKCLSEEKDMVTIPRKEYDRLIQIARSVGDNQY